MTCRVSTGTCALAQIQRNLLFESTCQKYWQFEADTAAEPVEVEGSSNGLVSLVACSVVINNLQDVNLLYSRSPCKQPLINYLEVPRHRKNQEIEKSYFTVTRNRKHVQFSVLSFKTKNAHKTHVSTVSRGYQAPSLF
jgi:hypothetical protein